MHPPSNHTHPSIAKFQQFVELKDYRPPTRKEYVRYVRKLAEHFHCDPLTLSEDQLRQYFTHQDRASGQTRALRLSGQEFLRRFLQHVLPTGFQRVRHYGWLSPAARKRWQRIHALLDWKPGAPPVAAAAPCWAPLCPRCQKPMRLLGPFARSPP